MGPSISIVTTSERTTNKVFPPTLRSATRHPPASKTTPTKRYKEVNRHVRQRRRRRRGGGSVRSQLEVQQINTFDTATRSEAAAAGTGKSIDYATTPFLGSPSPCPSIRPYDHQLYCSMAGFALLRWERTLLICHSCCAGPLSLDITNLLTLHLS